MKDERYANEVEAILTPLFLTFVAQSERDYDTLMSNLNDKMKIRVNAVQLSHKSVDSYKPIYSRNQV